MAEKILSSRKESQGYDPNACWGEYDTVEKKEKLGCKEQTVQGFGDLLDVNKLVSKMTPQQMMELKAKHDSAKYGIASNDSIRDILVKTQNLHIDFKELPALMREKFNNDEFRYLEFLQKNKDNKYVLAELHAEIAGSPSFKAQLEQQKRQDEADKNAILERNKDLAQQIAAAINPNP